MGRDGGETWTPAEAADLRQGVAAGRIDAATELGPPGPLVIDLDGELPAGRPTHPEPSEQWPPSFGWVVIGISHAAGRAAPLDCDVALTTTAGADSPWVTVDDLDQAVADMRDRIRANPVAAVTTAQVLRSRRHLDDDLVVESLAYAALQGGAEHRAWLASRPPGQPRPPAASPVLVHRTGDELTITLNRPEVRNAYDAAMRDHLVATLQLAVADDTVRHVVLRGNGASFCSGGDLNEFGTATDPAAAHLVRAARSAGWWLARCAARTTARVHGSCVGAGIELPAFASRVVAVPGTTFRLPEVGMGLLPGAGGTASLPGRVGRHRTAWLALSGSELPVTMALEWGLVDAIDDARVEMPTR